MKTRQEMIYEFMVALASNPSTIDPHEKHSENAEYVESMAKALTDNFLENAQ
jgi:hypothetical protein